MKRILTGATATLIVAALTTTAYSAPEIDDRGYLTSAAADSAEWKNLFDGHSLKGWHGYNKKGSVSNWVVENGVLVCKGIAKDASGGDLVTDSEFENFELTWDWKISPGGNSGLMYHVIESPKYSAPYETGPEYQMIDDSGYPGKLEESQKTGGDYGMFAAKNSKKVKPAGEWNTSKIIFNKGHVEHWLNGEKIVEFKAWNDEWTKMKKEGKWNDYPDYGTARKGRIALQDHGDQAFFRNIKIRVL